MGHSNAEFVRKFFVMAIPALGTNKIKGLRENVHAALDCQSDQFPHKFPHSCSVHVLSLRS